MDLQTRKLDFIQEFLKIQNEDMILQFEKLLKRKKNSEGEFSKPITLKELNERIDVSEANFRNKRYKSNSEIFEKYSK